MTLTEAAILLNRSPATLRQQIAKGKLKAEKRGRDWWITPHEVGRYRAYHLTMGRKHPEEEYAAGAIRRMTNPEPR